MFTWHAGRLIVPTLANLPVEICPAGRLLPSRVLGEQAREVLTELPAGGHETCAAVEVACGGRLEPLALYCESFLSCRLGAGRRHSFMLTPAHDIGWDDRALDWLFAAVEIPFQAALPKDQWRRTVADLAFRFAFSLDRLSDGIQALRRFPFEEIAQRCELCLYIHRRPFVLPERGAHFHRKLDALERRLPRHRSAQVFDDDLRALRI